MKILHRSILKELIVAFFLSLASLNFILMMEKLLRLSRFLSGVGTSAADMGRLILYLQPPLLLLTIPMAFLLATLLVYGRLNMDSEIVIMRMSGLSLPGLAKPVMTLGLLCLLMNLAISFYIGPKSGVRLKEEVATIIKTRTPLAIEEGRFTTYFKDLIMFVHDKPSDTEIRGVFIYDDRNKEEPKVVYARRGRVVTQDSYDISFLLEDGHLNIVKGSSTTELFFKKYNLVIELDPDLPARKNVDLTPAELIQRIRQPGDWNRASTYLELHRRFSLPFLCVILIFFGPPLSLLAGKTGKLGGLTIGLSVFALYYMMLIYGENLAKSGKIPYVAGSWGATLVLGTLALFLFLRERRR